MQQFDAIWINASIATMTDNGEPYGSIEDAVLAVKDGLIAFVGRRSDLPAFDSLTTPIYDAKGQWILPGFIDCHTHLVYAGSRANEFEMRLNGADYQQIAAAGGGIRSTVAATRLASHEQLFVLAKDRLNVLLSQGVTTVEIKSGYGLDLATEQKILEVAAELERCHPVSVQKTFLGAHALPAEFANDADGYIDAVCQMMPVLQQQKLIDAVDVFCEGIGFSTEQSRKVFSVASELGLPVKAHAEQLSNIGGSALVAEFGGLSADHIEFLDEAGVAAMAQAGTVAVLLPGAYYFLRETQLPPIELLRRYRVPMAVATDLNPGTSPLCSLPLMLNMACTLFRLTPQEALLGVTRYAALALGLKDRGTLAVGQKADFACYGINQPAELCYQFGVNQLKQLIINGKEVNYRM
ncbi:imidazolonepropionase [Rheinheimera aquimaris]|jgi:imidazolonepropionase|uniref:imidazolonepropionase n=1 Tax=Rheinheimera aquimaris TaxID=412437 RepID=UPI001064D579|nr:imidazolonepropionase [Rheinheimera aquimaris]|tara:strand:- start:5688 stop:6914 length:1227 start_codon:yes stop_codon:yes gene_type:complete